MAKIPIYNSEHDIEVARLAKEYERKHYTVIINVAEKRLRRIPDLLVVSPKGQIEWIEMESKRHSRKKHRLKAVLEALHQVKGKLKVMYFNNGE